MVAVSGSSASTVSSAYPTSGQSSSTSIASDTTADIASTAPADTVTLSSDAQAALAAETTSSDGSSKAAVSVWTSAAVTQALAALNDTSGQTSVADQVSAYTMMMGLIANGKNFDPSNSANAGAVQAATAFSTSTFTQKVQQLYAQYGAFNGGSTPSQADNDQQLIAWYGALSSDDQQSLVAAVNANAAASGTPDAYASTASFGQYLQAESDVSLAVGAAFTNPTNAAGMAANSPNTADFKMDAYSASVVSVTRQAQAAGDDATVSLMPFAHGGIGDAWTAAVEAHFSQYGAPAPSSDAAAPAPASTYAAPSSAALQAEFQDLQTLNDTSGDVSLSDQLSAYNTIVGQVTSHSALQFGAEWMSVAANFDQSPFLQEVVQAQDTYSQTYMAPDGTPGSVLDQRQITAFDNLTPDQQEIVVDPGADSGFASVSSFQAYQQVSLGLQAVLESAYASGALQQGETASSVSDPGLAQVLSLAQENGHDDAWTAQAQAALSAYLGDHPTGGAIPGQSSSLASLAGSALAASKTLSASAVGLQLLQTDAQQNAKISSSKGDSTPRQAPSAKAAAGRLANTIA